MRHDSKEREAAFREAFASLNAAQKQAVTTIEGPVMVIAGPGTGKTQILTLRIANILLETDTKPDAILALTFTEAGAKAMRERLRKYIGSAAYKVPIFTFHGFAQYLISRYPDAYVKVVGGRPASDLEKIKIITTIIDDGEVKKLRPMGNPSYYVTHILRMIGILKQEYISADKLSVIIDKQADDLNNIEQLHTKGAHKGKVRSEYTKAVEKVEKNKELLYVYRRYEAVLTQSNLYDFEDMIVETVEALSSNESMLRDLQEQYHYLLADEHQDVNGSQNRILELLASYHNSPNIFAVGDEKQAIYRFQGASLENFLRFTDVFSDVEVISLTDNYRSGQEILDAAHSLVEVDEGPLKDLRIPLKAVTVPQALVERRTFSHQAFEDSWIADDVKKELETGRRASEIAVIARTNYEVEKMSALLRSKGIAVTASADGDILSHPIMQSVSTLIDAVVDYSSDQALFALLHEPYLGIPDNDVLRILSSRSYDSSLIEILSSEASLEAVGVINTDACLKVFNLLKVARDKQVSEAPHQVLQYVLNESGLVAHLMVHDPYEGVRVVRRLYDEVEELTKQAEVNSLSSVREMLSTRKAYNLPLTAPYIATKHEAVQVLTAHKSKGLEYELVYIPHLTEKNWNGSGKKQYFHLPLTRTLVDEDEVLFEDERRLLYVAITRAKTRVCISGSEMSSEGKPLQPASLLDSIELSLIEEKDVTAEEAQYDLVEPLLSNNKPANIEIVHIKQVLKERGFSATSLNNYMRSPWDYIYRNVLRIPEVQPPHMQYGTAVHNTLQYITGKHSKGESVDTTNLKSKLEKELGRLPLSTLEFTRLLDKGLVDITHYCATQSSSWPVKTKEETSIKVVLQTGIPELPELPLTGKLDRLDFGKDGNLLQVVDYKTGKPKTRNVIEGKTKDSDGGYKRQLVFYALLLRLYEEENYDCRNMTLSFVEADTKGAIHNETYTITDEEIDKLVLEIKQAVADLLSGQALEADCDDKKSDYCHLVKRWKGS